MTEFFTKPANAAAAVLTLDEAGSVVSADDTSVAMFGWDREELIGQNVTVLLKNGLDNAVGRFLQRSKTAEASKETSSWNVVARRKDGSEFPVSVTPLTWNSDTTLTRKTDPSRFTWTAVFRELAGGSDVAPLGPAGGELSGRLPDEQLVKVDSERYAQKQAEFEAELRGQLEATKAAAERAETAHREEATRNRHFEERVRTLADSLRSEHSERAVRFDKEIIGLKETREQLQAKLVAEQESTVAAARRSEELTGQVHDRAAEVERVKSELEEQTLEYSRLQHQWHQALEAKQAMADTLETALSQVEEIIKRSEEELVPLRQDREQLNAKLALEKKATAESNQRVEDLEQRLRENSTELERVQAELKRSGHGKGFETEQASLHQMRDMLGWKLAAEKRANDEAKQRREAFESQLCENSIELERAKADADKCAEELARQETQLQAKLDSAQAALEQAEAALKKKEASCAELEQELVSLKGTRNQLQALFEAEQEKRADSERHEDELTRQLRQNADELEQVQAAAEKDAAEQARVETELRAQQDASRAATERAETALRDEATRHREFQERLRLIATELRAEQSHITQRFESELAKAWQAHRELQDRLSAEQQATAESKQRNRELEERLQASAHELKRLETDQSKEMDEQRGLESKLREQLAAAKAATEKAAEEEEEQAERFARLEKEAKDLRKTHNEFKAQADKEQQASAKSKRRIKELEKSLQDQVAERKGQDSDWQNQLAAAKAAAAQAEETLKEKLGQLKRFEHDMSCMREERHALHAKFVEEQRTGSTSKRRIKDLENQLRDSAAGFAQFKLELEKRIAEFESTKAAAQQAETGREEACARATRLAEETDGLRQIHDELSARYQNEQKVTAEARQHIEDLENRLRESAAELARSRAALENQAAERARLDADRSAADNTAELNKELGRLRENEAAHAAELAELERRVRESVTSQARVTADLEQERGERRRVEQRSTSLTGQLQHLHEELKLHLETEKSTRDRLGGLEQKLHEREKELTRVSADWQKETAERQLAEEQLRSVGDMSAQLRSYLSLFEESKRVFQRTQEELQAKLQASLKGLSESESRLQKETSECQRLEEALASAQRQGNEQVERVSLEMAKLQSDLQMEQMERKRLEGDALQSRYASLDSTRVGRNMVNSFRRQVRQPVEHVIQSTRRLLEINLDDEQKKLVQSVLENAMFVQTSLQQTGGLTGEPGAVLASDQETQPPQP